MDHRSWNVSLGRNGAALLSLPLLLSAAAGLGTVGAAAGGHLEPNRYFGIRLPSLLTSDRAWRLGHKAAILPFSLGVIVSSLLSLWAVWYPHDKVATIVLFVVAYSALLVGGMLGILLAEQQAKSVQRSLGQGRSAHGMALPVTKRVQPLPDAPVPAQDVNYDMSHSLASKPAKQSYEARGHHHTTKIVHVDPSSRGLQHTSIPLETEMGDPTI